MTINEAMKKYRLPNPTTPEDLECRWSKVLTFGDKIVMAGYFYNGMNKPCYFGAAYEFLTAVTLPVFAWSKNSFTEQTISLWF